MKNKNKRTCQVKKKIHSLNEGLEYKDMQDMIKPTVFIDEFKSKVGEDDAYIVLSFYVHNIVVAEDLVRWFEAGYDWVVDADRSPGEIEPNHYLVFVEVKRRTQIIEQLQEMLEDLETLDDHKLMDWTVTYDGQDYSYEDPESLQSALILSPRRYREVHEMDLNEMRIASGLPPKNIYESNDEEMNHFRTLAHLPVKK